MNGEVRDDRGRLIYAPRSNYGAIVAESLGHIPDAPLLKRNASGESGVPLGFHEVRSKDSARERQRAHRGRVKARDEEHIQTMRAPLRPA